MTSEARESSFDEGVPIKLFRFTRSSLNWYYTSADREIEFDGQTYTPTVISHTEIRDGAERNKAGIKIQMPKDLAVAANWRPYPPGDAIAVTIFTQHDGEDDYLVDWIGRCVQPRFDDRWLTIVSEPTLTRARRGGRGRCWQLGCDVPLYSKGLGMCNVDPEPIAVPATLTAVDGTTLTAAEFADTIRTLAGSFITWTNAEEELEQRAIVTHEGDTITIDEAGEDLEIGSNVTAYTVPLWKLATLTAVDGLTLTADVFGDFPSGRLAGGFITWTRSDGLIEYRSINAHSGTSIDIDYSASDLAEDLEVKAYPGCNQTWTDCEFYQNTDNYGGELHMPGRDYYDGNPVR